MTAARRFRGDSPAAALAHSHAGGAAPFVEEEQHPAARRSSRRLNNGWGAADTWDVANNLGPTRPDRLTIWPVEGDLFGIDVRWTGATGNRRATVVARLLADAEIEAASLRRSTAPGRSGSALSLGETLRV